jgi:hypothetical protein
MLSDIASWDLVLKVFGWSSTVELGPYVMKRLRLLNDLNPWR